MSRIDGTSAADNGQGPARVLSSVAELEDTLGQVLGVSEWLTVTQPMIDDFARSTGDLQWIHVDTARAAEGPFGTTIAHGFLLLSLIPAMARQAYVVRGAGMSINYGLNRVRFTSPVGVGSRIRASFVPADLRAIDGGCDLTVDVAVEIEGGQRPACVAQTVSRFLGMLEGEER